MNKPLYQTISTLDRWLITILVMSATLMQVIDTTIINVALPHMQGSLGASSNEITWTLTSYLISSAIFMPLTGYFSDRLGRKQYLIISIIGFTIVSALCGASTSLSEIILFRLLQGIFGASLVPLSQTILTDIFPPKERGKAMAIWGIGVMVGPILGPTLGGYLTDIANWRFTFYVNIPIGIFTLSLIHIIPDSQKIKRHMDWLGLFFVSFAIGGLQYILDRGNQNDWFNATHIRIIAYLTLTSVLVFILYRAKQKEPVFNMRIFKDKNFSIACVLLCFFGLGLYGTMVIQPLMMEGLFNYPALTAGLMIAPRGISGMVSMIIVSKIITPTNPRQIMIVGMIICILGLFASTNYSLDVSPIWIIVPMIIQGFGLGMIFVPLSTIAFSTLNADLRTEAAGLFSLIRTIGGSVGISIAITLLTRRTQLFWNELGGSLNIYHDPLLQYFNLFKINPTESQRALLLSQELYRQATMLSFINIFDFIMWCFVIMIPLTLLLKKGEISRPVEITAD